MATMLTKEEIKGIKKSLNQIDDVEFNPADIDYDQVREALMSSELSQLVNCNNETKLLITKDADGIYHEAGNESKKIDEKYYPIIEAYTAFNSGDEEIDMNFIRRISSMLEDFISKLQTLQRKGNKSKKQLIEVATNIDEYYTKLRKGIIESEKECDENFIETLLFLPDLVVYFFRYLASDDVPVVNKTKVFTALIYIINPLDLIPEHFTGPIGYLDDTYIALNVFKDILFEENLDKDNVYDLWPGTKHSIDNIDQIVNHIDTILGEKLIAFLKVYFELLNMNKKKVK